MSYVNNYILLCRCPHEDFEMAPRWLRLDHLIVGDGKALEADIFARVTNFGANSREVAEEIRAIEWNDPEQVTLLSLEQGCDRWAVVDWRGEGEAILVNDLLRLIVSSRR